MSKVAFIVTDMDNVPITGNNGVTREFKTDRLALKAAEEVLANSCGSDAEVWVWRLSHILSKPSTKPDIEKVR